MIIQIIINSLICFGIYNATRYNYSVIEQKVTRNEALGFIKKYGDEWLPYWATKPLYNCPPCMGSFWSIITGLSFGFTGIVWVIIATSGLNYILTRLFPYDE